MNIKPYEKNAKKHPDEQLRYLALSLKEYGWRQPIVVDKNNEIIVGHGRWAAYQKYPEGINEPWVETAADLTPEQVKGYRLMDNKSNESDWDMALVVEELRELDAAGFDLDLTGFDSDLLIEPSDNDDTIPTDAPTRAKMGDLWLLGEHRVLCGDSTDLPTVERLMDGKKADMVFTDPPYKIQTKGGTKSDVSKALQKQGNAIEFIADFNPTDFLNTLPIFFNSTMNAYVFCNKELLPDYLVWARDAGYSFNVLVWKKPNAIPIGDSHRPDIEYLLLFRKNAIWNNGLSSIVNYSRLIESPRETGLHPTMKPVGIITNQLLISSHDGSLVVDTFLGSGSTLIAAEKTGRVCYGMELDPKYVDVIIKRWEDYTGKTATKHG
tara:strand:+ start:52 stop:1191 length:1140 start_codon:yes stop_codon:yes gene_type:complete